MGGGRSWCDPYDPPYGPGCIREGRWGRQRKYEGRTIGAIDGGIEDRTIIADNMGAPPTWNKRKLIIARRLKIMRPKSKLKKTSESSEIVRNNAVSPIWLMEMRKKYAIKEDKKGWLKD